MDDAVRFCDGDDEAARRLMLAMRDERPPEGAASRALVALGAGSAAMLTTTAAAGGVAAAGTGVTLGKSLTGLAFKWLGAGAAIGVVAATGATVLPRAGENAAGAPAPVVVSAPKVAAPVRAPAQPARAEPAAIAEPAPAPEATPAAPAPVARASNAPPRELVAAPAQAQSVARFEAPRPADSLEREIELLDRARSALRSSAPGEALARLDGYAREFPRGRLSSEAFVVRLEALVRANRTAEARSLAGAHLARNPGSPHAARIRRLVGLAP